MQLQFHVLGTVEVLDGDRPLPVGGPRQRLLLAALLAGRRQVVSIDALSEVLWSDDPPRTARATLQTSVSKLRRLLTGDSGVELAQRPPGYMLVVPPSAVDADRFVEQLERARGQLGRDPGAAVEGYDRALALWAGSAFAGLEHLSCAQPEVSRLEELRLQAIEERNEARLAVGDAAAVVSELEGVARTEPARERMWCLLMTALHRCGRQAEALRAGDEFRRHLREDLGLDPSATFRAVEREILDAESPSSSPDVGPRTTAARGDAGWQTPVLAAPLIGRADALDEVEGLLRRSRVVTLTGPGGVGKSVMALEVARRVRQEFADGVRVAELAPVADGAAAVTAVAQSVHAERRSDRTLIDAVVEVLGTRQMLLLVDNCEHVIDDVGELLAQVVRWCPSVTVLATSREPLGLSGEVVRSVAPLSVPLDPGAPLDQIAATPAVEVFVARVADVSPDFELTATNARAVAELCIQLDGLPLALELAAARMSSMTPQQLVERLNERFALLSAGRGRDPRHRTLRELVQWSYSLLDDGERDLFARISVFAGGFDLDAAERVGGGGAATATAVAGVLAGLVDKSLVGARHGEPPRYSQLETLRQFGADRLAERPDAVTVHRSHVATFVERCDRWALQLDASDESSAMRSLWLDADNVRAAFWMAVALEDADSALRMVLAMSEPGFRAIRYEVIDWAEAALSMPGTATHPLRPAVAAVVGYGAFVRGELERAVEIAEDATAASVALGVDTHGMSERVLGNALFYLGRHEHAVEAIAEMVEVHRSSGRAGRLAHALYMRSVAASSTGDPDSGARYAEESMALAERLGNPTARSQATYAAGLALVHLDPEQALELLERSAALADTVGNLWMRSFARTEAMWLRSRRGAVPEALEGYREIVQTWFRGGDWANQWLSLRHLAGILASCGRDEEAALLAGAVRSAGAQFALPIDPRDATELNELHAQLASRLGDDAMDRAATRAASMRDDAAVGLALAAIDTLLADAGPLAATPS